MFVNGQVVKKDLLANTIANDIKRSMQQNLNQMYVKDARRRLVAWML